MQDHARSPKVVLLLRRCQPDLDRITGGWIGHRVFPSLDRLPQTSSRHCSQRIISRARRAVNEESLLSSFTGERKGRYPKSARAGAGSIMPLLGIHRTRRPMESEEVRIASRTHHRPTTAFRKGGQPVSTSPYCSTPRNSRSTRSTCSSGTAAVIGSPTEGEAGVNRGSYDRRRWRTRLLSRGSLTSAPGSETPTGV